MPPHVLRATHIASVSFKLKSAFATSPCSLQITHVSSRSGPNFEVVRTHEEVRQTSSCKVSPRKMSFGPLPSMLPSYHHHKCTIKSGGELTHHSNNPFVKSLGLGLVSGPLLRRVNHSFDTLDLLLDGKHGDIILQIEKRQCQLLLGETIRGPSLCHLLPGAARSGRPNVPGKGKGPKRPWNERRTHAHGCTSLQG